MGYFLCEAFMATLHQNLHENDYQQPLVEH